VKHSTTNTLLTAKSIFSEAKSLISVGDKHSCTAGIILLQDSVELIVLGILDELDTEEQRNLESKSFDELIGELKKQSIPVYKSGTLKAMNKQRVISKHYGQLAEPASVVNYLKTANQFIDKALVHVVGKTLSQIFLVDLVHDCPAKEHLVQAIQYADQENYLEALIEIRKAFYMAYEKEYCVYDWRDQNNQPKGLFSFIGMGGQKAYHWTKNAQWINENVRKPSDYVQVNHEQLKIDCIEWGLSTNEIDNLRRLTPDVVQTEKGAWHVDYDFTFPANEATNDNFNYCMDVIINFLIKEQTFNANRKWPSRDKAFPAPPVYIGKNIYEKPSRSTPIIHVVQEGYLYTIERMVTGFDHSERYQYLMLYQEDPETGNRVNYVWGYLYIEDGIVES
jgi:hypothetical protein